MILTLPISKSVAIRKHFCDALSGAELSLKEAAEEALNDDITTVYDALKGFQMGRDIRVKGSATGLRFLIAYAALSEGERYIYADEQLQKRPIKPLIEALRGAGAQIEYGAAIYPLKITGRKLEGGIIAIKATESSQYISALMLIASRMAKGLEIRLLGENPVSNAYINLTAGILAQHGVEVKREGNNISIAPQMVTSADIPLEADWSSAIPFISSLAVKQKGSVLFENLHLQSKQPERNAVAFFERLGVVFTQQGDSLKAEYEPNSDTTPEEIELNCSDMPDSAMLIMTTCAIRGIKCSLSGVEHLVHKESDRIATLIETLAKCGYEVQFNRKLQYNNIRKESGQPAVIDTYADHRVAMVAAVLSLSHKLTIMNPECVSKSFPHFWDSFNDLKRELCLH